MVIQSPAELLVRELAAIQDAETQAAQAIGNGLSLVQNEELTRLLERRLEQGKHLLQEVAGSLERLGAGAASEQNAAARGLIKDAEKLVELAQTPELKQVVLIAGVQKLEHYCIAVWGTVRALANELGEQELVRTMQTAVEEGYVLDHELTNLAEGRVNPEAADEAELAAAEEGQDEQSASGSSRSEQPANDDEADLKAREYTDKEGRVHHHTREYMERKAQ